MQPNTIGTEPATARAPGHLHSKDNPRPEPQTAQPYTVNGRRWIADDPAHAIQQHNDASTDEGIERQPVLATVAQSHYVVTVHHTTGAEAAPVMAERLGHDEDYGFPYAIEYVNADALPVITVGADAAVLPIDVFRADDDALGLIAEGVRERLAAPTVTPHHL